MDWYIYGLAENAERSACDRAVKALGVKRLALVAFNDACDEAFRAHPDARAVAIAAREEARTRALQAIALADEACHAHDVARARATDALVAVRAATT